MIIRFTPAELRPVIERLNQLGDKHRPREATPERWKKILAGKAYNLAVEEVNGIVRVLGWDTLFALTDKRDK